MTDENPVRVYTQLSVLYSTCLLQERRRANNLFLQLKINTATFRKTLRRLGGGGGIGGGGFAWKYGRKVSRYGS